MSKICAIDAILLEPYSSERLIVVSGYNYEELLEWYQNAFGKPESNKLSEIKDFYNVKNQYLKFFKDNQEELDGLDKDGGGIGEGVYIYRKIPNTDSKIRMVILKYGFTPSNPHHMRTLAHEMLHVCQELLPQFLNRDEEMEAEAYFHSYLMESCYKLFL